MSPSRLPHKTLADYVAIALCPVLIMGLVGSLIFFLLAVGGAGTQPGPLRWTFFWFVLAMVLVSRIAIERGSEYAGAYGFCLAAATAIVLTRFAGFNLWMWVLLGLIWWATNKLTWDCTVIDEDEDASGEGLLQAAQLERPPSPGGEASFESAPVKPEPSGNGTKAKKAPVRWWERGLAKAPRRPHAPGLWILYFSLGAFPIFGLGEGLISRQAFETRQCAFYLLTLYLAAAVGLLLATSFLGLRRYLRQRRLQMPSAMAANWLATGGIMGAAILLGCSLLPRPSAYWAFAGSFGLRMPAQSEKKTAWSKLPPVSGGATNYEKSGSGQRQSAGTSQSAGKANSATDDQGQRQENGAGEMPVVPWHIPPVLLNWLRLATWLGLAVLALVVAVKNRHRLATFLAQFWRALAEFWGRLFAGGERSVTAAGVGPHSRPPAPFATLVNPFATGEAERLSIEELVVRSFQGLEAWAAEHQWARAADQTPFEFAERLAGEAPGLAEEARQAARLYAQVAYAKTASLASGRLVLEILWSKMTQERGV